MGSGQHSKRSGGGAAWTTVVLLGVAAVVGVSLVAARPQPDPTTPSAVAATSAAAEAVPYQFIAKAYTELLGRTPTPDEWAAGTVFFEQHRCTATSLEQFGDTVVASAEYRRDYPTADAGSIALTLFRFVLNREPDAAEFVAQRDRLDTASPLAVAASLFATAEFTGRTEPAICNPTDAGYSFGEPGDLTGHPAIQTPATGAPGPDANEAALQFRLDVLALSGGGTFALPARQVTGLTTTLTIPGNVTLTTAGGPDPSRYADMARLVRLASFTQQTDYAGAELVSLQPGARLVHVWVDGQRDGPDPHTFLDFDVRMLGGAGTTVRDDRIGNTFGASDLEDDTGTPTPADPTGCEHNVVSDNLVEGYASDHEPPSGDIDDHTQADGLGIVCGSTEVEGNDIVDISDAAIVLFNASEQQPQPASVPPQLSLVADNTIISAGSSMYFGIATDPFWSLGTAAGPGGDPDGVDSRAFATPTGRAVIRDNHIWTGERTHIDVLLSSGTHDLFGSTAHQNCLLPDAAGQASCGGGRNASGATWVDNTSDGLPSWAEMGIYVGGTQDATLSGNRFPHLGHVTGGTCPKGAVIVASGTGPATDFAPGLRIDQPVTRDSTLDSDLCVTPSF
ncbi:MAG: hypothetical protein ACLQOZ_11375 [Acidimicrobiales bacterium]|jgi:hypothetical protein